jgi:hypothetical protein
MVVTLARIRATNSCFNRGVSRRKPASLIQLKKILLVLLSFRVEATWFACCVVKSRSDRFQVSPHSTGNSASQQQSVLMFAIPLKQSFYRNNFLQSSSHAVFMHTDLQNYTEWSNSMYQRPVLVLFAHLGFGFQVVCFPQVCPPTSYVHHPYLSYVLRAQPIYFAWFYYQNNIWWGVQTTKLFPLQLSPVPCYFISLRLKYLPRHLFINTLNLCSSLSVTGQVSQVRF